MFMPCTKSKFTGYARCLLKTSSLKLEIPQSSDKLKIRPLLDAGLTPHDEKKK